MSAEFGKETGLPKGYVFLECECSESLHGAVTEDLVMGIYGYMGIHPVWHVG